MKRNTQDASRARVGGARRIILATLLLLGAGAIATDRAAAATPTYAPAYPTAIDLNQFGISGTWYDPAQSGQGFVISVMPDADSKGHAAYFGGWFTYADHWSGEWYQQALGTPMWLTLQGDTSNFDPSYGMPLAIYDNDGRTGNFAAPPTVPASQVGWAYLSMTDCNHMHLHFTVESRQNWLDPQWREMDLVRLMPNVSCFDTQTPPPPSMAGVKFSGGWYDPATSGQGFAFEINPAISSRQFYTATLFGGWFTYAASNVDQPQKGRRWYTLQGEVGWYGVELNTPSMLIGSDLAIYETTGGTFGAPNTPQTVITRKRVGTAKIVFGAVNESWYLQGQPFSCASAVLDYRFDAGENSGRGGSITLQRLGPTPADCASL